MKSYADGRLTSDEACRVASDIIRGESMLLPKPRRSQIFAYHCHQLSLAFRGTKGDSAYCRAAEQLVCAVIEQTRLLDELPHRCWKTIQMEWFVHVATGQNLRKARDLPLVLTKQSVHRMNEAPAHGGVPAAMRWGQLRAMGASRELCRALLPTRATTDFANDSFWMPLFRLMTREPGFHASVAPALVDYAYHRRFTMTDGDAYRITRRSIRSLMREIAGFYRAHPGLRIVEPEHLAAPRRTARRRRVINWPRLDGFREIDETRVDYDGSPVRWRLFELRRSFLLEIEGRRLGHCVAIYINDCRNGVSSIWSLRSFRGEAQRWEATIEVDPRAKAIVQVSSYRTSNPTHEAWAEIRRWAKLNSLEIVC
jgi:hypothetical protein